MNAALIVPSRRVMIDWIRCLWCWRVISYEVMHERGCGCKRSVKALNAWRESGMKGGIETGASIVIENYFGTWRIA